jgi:hypothetical protein
MLIIQPIYIQEFNSNNLDPNLSSKSILTCIQKSDSIAQILIPFLRLKPMKNSIKITHSSQGYRISDLSLKIQYLRTNSKPTKKITTKSVKETRYTN